MLREQLVEAFELRRKPTAVRLLPQVWRPADIRIDTTNDSVPGVWWSFGRSKVSLLHLAAVHGWMDVTIDLVTKYKCDVNFRDSDGRLPMHYAAMGKLGQLEVVQYFINEQHCDPMNKDFCEYTLLHYASHLGHLNIIQYLFNELNCNLSCETEFGDTPLQLACYNGQTHVVQFLLSTGEVNPLAKNKHGKTLVDYVVTSSRHDSLDILKMVQSFPQYKKDYPVHTYTKVILTGCSGAGKTTLSQVILLLAKESTSFFSKSSGRVADVECLTAGIIPHNVESKVKKVGNMVVYDFAGQQEYYSSHAAVLECVMGNSPAIFVCVINLNHRKEKITESIHYWISFMENASSSQESSHVIIIGSHADLIKSSHELNEKRLLVESIAKNRVKQLLYKGFLSMDCRQSKTKEARQFRLLLSTSQQAVLSSQPNMSLYCHMLYAYLCTKLEKKGCTLEELTSSLSSKEDISLDFASLTKSINSLSEKGLLVFVRNQETPQNSFVVVEKEALLREANGKLLLLKILNSIIKLLAILEWCL